MKKTIIEIIKKELSEYEANLSVFKGGMEKYIETLEDSDTFYNEASTIGAITALKDILLKLDSIKVVLEIHVDIDKINNLNDSTLVATLKTKNSQYDVIFRKKETEQFIDVSEVDDYGQYIAIEGKFQANMHGINQIKDLISSYENIEVVYRPDFDKLDDSVSFELSNVWISKVELELELSKQGIDTSFIEEIKTNELDCHPFLIDSDDYEWDSDNEVFKIKQKPCPTTLVEKNANLIVQNPKQALEFMFDNVENECSMTDPNGYLDCYFFYYNGVKYHIEIKNNKDIKLMKPDDSGWDVILNTVTKNQYSIIDSHGIKKLITVPEHILKEYWNEIISDIDYNSNNDGSGNGNIIIENNRYGANADSYKIEYTWQNANYDYLKISDENYEICGASKLELARIFSEKFFSKSELVSSFIDYCRGSGISINKEVVDEVFSITSKYKLILEDKYVAKIKNQYFIADDENGINSKPLEYLPEGIQMDFLNKLCDVFDDKIKIYAFKNNCSLFEEKRVIKLKEGEDDKSEGVNYIISNLVADWQLKHAFKLASFVWNEIDDESISFDDIAKKVKEQFNRDLYEIFDEEIPNSWYLILEMIFEDMNIAFQTIASKTFVI